MKILGALVCSVALSIAGCGDSDDDGGGSGDAGPKVQCTAISESGLPDGCTMSYDTCSDGHSYRVDCTGNQPYSCQCKVDDKPTGVFDTTDLCVLNGSIERAAVSKGCGWSLK